MKIWVLEACGDNVLIHPQLSWGSTAGKKAPKSDSRSSVQHPWINLQDQASNGPWRNHKSDSRSGVHHPWIKTSSRWKLWKKSQNPIQDQVFITLESKPVQDKICGKSTSTINTRADSPQQSWIDLSPTQDQASTALEGDPGPIQDQAKTALGSASTLRDFKTHLLHVTSTCIQHALKWGHL